MDKKEQMYYDAGMARGHKQADKMAYELKSMHSKNIAEQNKYHEKECKGRGYADKRGK
jgi:hypothetical protein